MKTKISIKYKNGIVVTRSDNKNELLALSLNASMMQLGYIASKELMDAIATLSISNIEIIYNDLISVLKNLKGADVNYAPMYPNFPAQVMEASDVELYSNALCHYWSAGVWTPKYVTLPRSFEFEHIEFREIGLITVDEFNGIFTSIVSSNDSISAWDKQVVEWFINNNTTLVFPHDIPFKENLCLIAGIMFNQSINFDLSNIVKTATDLLRIVTHLSGGDISLAENTRFRSLPRAVRRNLIRTLEEVINEEDIHRHKGKWGKLFHNLHVGEYRKQAPKVFTIAQKLRANKTLTTFNSKVERAIDAKDIKTIVGLLMQRPGEYARRLDHIMRLATGPDRCRVADGFAYVVDDVSTRVILQALGNLKIRSRNDHKKLVFPKGNVQKAHIINSNIPLLPRSVIDTLCGIMVDSLQTRFGKLNPLGKVWIDPALHKCPIPSQQRSASEGTFNVARGTNLPVGDKDTLRFFIYWVGNDIDLSATLHDANFNKIEHISYTILRSSKYEACHSGDITYAPNGASEFIDIRMDQAANIGARYICMNVLVYSGPTFAEHKKCHVGWMTRTAPKSNEIYDPKTVIQKIDVQSNCKNVIPVVFDLVERTAIWADLATNTRSTWGGNNIESNIATITDTMQAIVESANKVSLYELFAMHVANRGVLVDTKEEADMVYSMYEGITPYNITTINSEYLV